MNYFITYSKDSSESKWLQNRHPFRGNLYLHVIFVTQNYSIRGSGWARFCLSGMTAKKQWEGSRPLSPTPSRALLPHYNAKNSDDAVVQGQILFSGKEKDKGRVGTILASYCLAAQGANMLQFTTNIIN